MNDAHFAYRNFVDIIKPKTKRHREREIKDKKQIIERLTNREKFKKIFGLNIEEYNGWNDEFVILKKDGTKISAKWLDQEYVPQRKKDGLE